MERAINAEDCRFMLLYSRNWKGTLMTPFYKLNVGNSKESKEAEMAPPLFLTDTDK